MVRSQPGSRKGSRKASLAEEVDLDTMGEMRDSQKSSHYKTTVTATVTSASGQEVEASSQASFLRSNTQEKRVR